MSDFRSYVEGKVREDDGNCPYLTSPDGRPLPGDVAMTESFIHCDTGGSPAVLNLMYDADDFGEVVLHTRPLSGQDDPYNLSYELAAARLDLLESHLHRWQQRRFLPSRILREEMKRAKALLDKAAAEENINPASSSCLAERALTRLLWAGESMAVEAGRHGLEQKICQATAQQMLLGANCFEFGSSFNYNQRFADLFNYATLPFFWRDFEPQPGREQWTRIQAMLKWLGDNDITAKGHPLVYFTEKAYPEWARAEHYEEIKQAVVERAARVAATAGNDIAVWDVVNEAHDISHANMFALSKEQLVDITRAAARAVRQANPAAKSIINVCAPFGEYAAREKDRWCPLDYIEACLTAEVDFDAVGVQCYFGSGWAYCRDLLQLSDQLDLYGALGKPVHITEAACPSSTEPEPHDTMTQAQAERAGQWHGPWTESLQAEWVEKFYTICCGKPFVEAVSWWDLADAPQHLFTHGGLLRKDYSPKPAYNRLLELARKMGTKNGTC